MEMYLQQRQAEAVQRWDLLALVILVIVVVAFAVKRSKLKDEQDELEDQLSELYVEDSVEADKEL